MARRVMRSRVEVPERDDLARRIELVHGRRRVYAEPERRPLLDDAFVQKQIVVVQINGHAEHALRRADASHVVYVGVCEKDVADGERLALGKRQQIRYLVARIDQHRFTRVGAPDHEAVLKERAYRPRLDYDHSVILAILDDLMFTSKIKNAASQLGVSVTFARSSDAALAHMRRSAPSLVIFDLNNPRTDPIGTVVVMKKDSALAAIPTLGFASHVQTDVINAARQAGVDEVLARSAFTERLAEILGGRG